MGERQGTTGIRACLRLAEKLAKVRPTTSLPPPSKLAHSAPEVIHASLGTSLWKYLITCVNASPLDTQSPMIPKLALALHPHPRSGSIEFLNLMLDLQQEKTKPCSA